MLACLCQSIECTDRALGLHGLQINTLLGEQYFQRLCNMRHTIDAGAGHNDIRMSVHQWMDVNGAETMPALSPPTVHDLTIRENHQIAGIDPPVDCHAAKSASINMNRHNTPLLRGAKLTTRPFFWQYVRSGGGPVTTTGLKFGTKWSIAYVIDGVNGTCINHNEVFYVPEHR